MHNIKLVLGGTSLQVILPKFRNYRSAPRTVATFSSDTFNTSETKTYYYNPANFGDDFIAWLVKELCQRSVPTSQIIGQEDFGWYCDFEMPSHKSHTVLAGFRADGSNSKWILWIERKHGLFFSVLGARTQAIFYETAILINDILTASADIYDISWHYKQDVSSGREELGSRYP